MSKAVLLSIRPQWAEKIASGEKTIEVRKTRPNLPTPFKVYLYVTAGSLSYKCPNGMIAHCNGGREVIGEFVCDRITNLFADSRFWLNEGDILGTDLSGDEIRKYANGANKIYGWHISGLRLYDKPRQLEEFTGLRSTRFGAEPVVIKRPPQSWMYVEEM